MANRIDRSFLLKISQEGRYVLIVDRVLNYVGSKVKVWKDDADMKEIINGTVVALVLKVVGAGLTFWFNLLLARIFGADGTGIYFLALTITTIATIFGRVGLDNTLLRFVAANAAVNEWGAVKGVYQKGVRLALISSSISAVAMVTAAPLLAGVVFQKPELISPIRWMSLAVIPMTLLILHAEMLKGLKRIRDSLIVYGVGVPALSLLGLYFLGIVYGINGAVWAYTIAAMLTALLGVMLWRSAVPQLKCVSGHFETRELLKSSIPLFWVASVNMMVNWTATFALGIWAAKEDVGIFSLASRTAMLTSLILLSVNSISAPKFAALYRIKSMDLLNSTARNTAKLMTLMASPFLVIFLFAPRWIMGIYGPGFADGAILLSIMAIGQFVNVATGSVGYLLVMCGNERLMRNNTVFVAVLSVILNFVLVPLFGPLGAAISTAVCLSAMNLISAFLVRSKLGIWTIPFIGKGYEGVDG